MIEEKKSNKENIGLFLPFTYEDIIKKIGEKKSRLPDLIVPVTEFEEQIIQVLADMKYNGYLLFLYGVSGVGKSTFISSLQFQRHIPISQIAPIDASKLVAEINSPLKLQELIKAIKSEINKFFSEHNGDDGQLCIVIDYLENLSDEDQNNVRAFFRDLNSLLRKSSVLIIWPVTVQKDLDNMQNLAKNYSSTIFHRRLPYINFTGPPLNEYANIAKKTIMLLNDGKSCYEFQLNDSDFEKLKNDYENKPTEKRLIRDYLKDIKNLWEERTRYVSELIKSIPKPTEVWFIFSYPKAEDVIARFAKQTPEIIEEMWNADYKSLFAYIGNNQREATWKPQRLTLALSTYLLTTKIMYLPTNAFVSCIAGYFQEANIPIERPELIDKCGNYRIHPSWFGKKRVENTLKTTPLFLQLSNIPTRPGFRSSGAVPTALTNAQQPFEQFNKDISSKKISDQRFNHAICLALKDAFKDDLQLTFKHEVPHPFLRNIKPDILIESERKLICLEFCYTNNNTPGYVADYVLRKLDKYMKQIEDNFGLPDDFSW
ncbi:MAG: ATP-binding protein [Cyanobacterium sp. T60_A2020_053]|nr:ATP-binding protein [Cyanobacterium sp. T60_A2020_053]